MNEQTKVFYQKLREYEAMPISSERQRVGREICRYFGVADHRSPIGVISCVDDEWIVDNFTIKIKGHRHGYGMIILEGGVDHHSDCYRRGPFCLYRTMSSWIVLDKHGNLALDDIEIDETGSGKQNQRLLTGQTSQTSQSSHTKPPLTT
jgi:hypothetical protein